MAPKIALNAVISICHAAWCRIPEIPDNFLFFPLLQMAKLLAPGLPGWSMADIWSGLLVLGGSKPVVVLWLQQAWAVFTLWQPLGQPVREVGSFQVTFFLNEEAQATLWHDAWVIYLFSQIEAQGPSLSPLAVPGLWKLSRDHDERKSMSLICCIVKKWTTLSACGFKCVYTTQLLLWLAQQWIISKYSGCIIHWMRLSLLKHSLHKTAEQAFCSYFLLLRGHDHHRGDKWMAWMSCCLSIKDLSKS